MPDEFVDPDPKRTQADLRRFLGKVEDAAQRVRARAALDPIAQITLCRTFDNKEKAIDAVLETSGAGSAARSLVTTIAQIGRAFLGLPPSPEFLSSLVDRLDLAEPPGEEADRVVDGRNEGSDVCPWCAGPVITTGPFAPRGCEQEGCAGDYLWCADRTCEWSGSCSTLAVEYAGRNEKSPEEVPRCRGECGGTSVRPAALGWCCIKCNRLRAEEDPDAT